MVGRGPPGAAALLLSVLVGLTADGCRAQKGLSRFVPTHTAAATPVEPPEEEEEGGTRRHAAMLL